MAVEQTAAAAQTLSPGDEDSWRSISSSQSFVLFVVFISFIINVVFFLHRLRSQRHGAVAPRRTSARCARYSQRYDKEEEEEEETKEESEERSRYGARGRSDSVSASFRIKLMMVYLQKSHLRGRLELSLVLQKAQKARLPLSCKLSRIMAHSHRTKRVFLGLKPTWLPQDSQALPQQRSL